MSETAIMTEEATEEVVTESKPYKLRELQSKDIYPVSKIIGKIGVKNFEVCFTNESLVSLISEKLSESKDGQPVDISVEDVTSFGIGIVLDVVDVILEKLPCCEEYVNQLLSNLSGMSKADIATLPLGIYTEMIIDVIKMDGFKDFVKAVSKLVK